MLSLFHTPGACSLASCIALEEIRETTDVEYEVKTVSFAKGDQHKPEYLTINPKGRVPALSTESGILTETPAILLYLAQRYPAANLAPLDDIFGLAQLQSFNSFLCSTVHVAHAHKFRGSRWANEQSSLDDMKAKVTENMTALFTQIEETYLKDSESEPWVMGANYTIGDAYLYTIACWLAGDGVDIAIFPRLNAHFNRMENRPAVQRAIAK
ncbi:glutathione S-transferase family protein [Kiloniella antarctica]|uniref:Glutathione S-transferase family protein n=1 Tax=Kiloniella antarctica TaxID=1550907 RepID=A0ABW5BIH0_9PROT